MLIPYPFALLSSAWAFDIAGRVAQRYWWSTTAEQLTYTGIATALVAAVPGIVDYFGTVPPQSSARRSATRHALCNLSGVACFALAAVTRRRDGYASNRGIAMATIGTGLLSIGGWLGGKLVYQERVGVVGQGRRELTASIDEP